MPLEGETTIVTIAAAAFLGVVIFYLGNVAFIMCLLQARKPSIQIFWYFTPALSIFWLFSLNLTEITYLIILGAMLIMSANALLAISQKKLILQKKQTNLR